MAAVLLLAPATAYAAGGAFTDDDNSSFESNIEWLADAGVTKGCNPPTNDLFCPDDNVTRGQMAAFMQRFAQFLGAEDGQVSAADDADTVGGMTVDEIRTTSPLTIPAAAFNPDGGGAFGDHYLSWSANGWQVQIAGTGQCFQAPVILPHGAELGTVDVVAIDAAGDGFYAIHTAPLGDPASTVEALATSVASTDPQTISIDASGMTVPAGNQSWIGVCMYSLNDTLYGATVTYTLGDSPAVSPVELKLGSDTPTSGANGS